MQNKPKRNKSHIILWLALFILIVLQVTFVLYIAKLQGSVSQLSKDRLSDLINKSEESRYKYPVIDVTENRVYIPEARIYIPLNETSRNIRYDYFNLKGHEAVYFSMSSIVGRQTDQDDPSCDKVVSLTKPGQTQAGSLYSSAGTITPTQDGLSTIYVHADCKMYSDGTKANLVDAIKLVKQY
jgi:hypothetical protein